MKEETQGVIALNDMWMCRAEKHFDAFQWMENKVP